MQCRHRGQDVRSVERCHASQGDRSFEYGQNMNRGFGRTDDNVTALENHRGTIRGEMLGDSLVLRIQRKVDQLASGPFLQPDNGRVVCIEN